ncbi:MAG: hypothetical protein HY681_00455 [Chloroflexi bacterium]|nr:hypothetical protein [Chloroflexota bacterium]
MKATFNWDFQAWQAFHTLGEHYLRDQSFLAELEALADSMPPIPMGGLLPDDPEEDLPSIADLVLKGGVEPGPDGFNRMAKYYIDTGRRFQQHYQDHPWLGNAKSVAERWGLYKPGRPHTYGAAWGLGLLLAMLFELRFLRGPVRVGDRPASYDLWGSIEHYETRLPNLLLNRYSWDAERPPRPLPGMTKEQWNRDVARWKRAGLVEIENYRNELPNVPLWKASYREMVRDVAWLYERITPPYRTPQELALRDGVGQRLVEDAIGKASTLIGLRISPGVQRPHKRSRL